MSSWDRFSEWGQWASDRCKESGVDEGARSYLSVFTGLMAMWLKCRRCGGDLQFRKNGDIEQYYCSNCDSTTTIDARKFREYLKEVRHD